MTWLILAVALSANAHGDELAPAQGRLLVATESVGGEIFAKTVILLLHYDESGAMGLVINRPTDVTPQELFAESDTPPDYGGVLYWGGPVQMASVRALLHADAPPEGAQAIFDSIHLVAVDEALDITASSPDNVRIYIGYAGWAAGQLDYEIARGSWHVLPASAGNVFAPDPRLLWQKLRSASEFRVTNQPGSLHPGPPAHRAG